MWNISSVFSLFVMDDDTSGADEAALLIEEGEISLSLLSKRSIVIISRAAYDKAELEIDIRQRASGYRRMHLPAEQAYSNFTRRLGSRCRWAIVRPDFYIFALCRSAQELEHAIMVLKTQFHGIHDWSRATTKALL